MPKYNVKIEVIDILGEGKCSMDQKIGDVYRYPEDRGKMCPTSFCIMWPMILVMLSGGSFDGFEDDGTSTTVGCSEYMHNPTPTSFDVSVSLTSRNSNVNIATPRSHRLESCRRGSVGRATACYLSTGWLRARQL
jgi:uncharacterized repeat protein (TIGR04076 family)